MPCSLDIPSGLFDQHFRSIPASALVGSPAADALRKLEAAFRAFSETLRSNQDFGIALASFGSAYTIVVDSVQASGQNLLIIRGTLENAPVVLVQHVNQLNFLMVPVPRQNPDSSPRRVIGFSSE